MVIGGYAVNAYALPRFSVDCDVVVNDPDELEKIKEILLEKGYRKVEPNTESQYSGSFLRYEKKLENNFSVSIDILINNVTDRMTGVVFDAEWVFLHAQKKVLRGKTITEQLNLKIIGIDALLVMKMISCRNTDIRDVFMMFPNAQDKEWIKSEVSQRFDFQDRITTIINKIISKQFKDGLSGVYGHFNQKVFEKHQKAILEFSKP